MRKQNVLLLTWLALPLVIIVGLMAWIMVTFRDDKPMADAPPVGAGAGDTGGANAIGELLRGRLTEPGTRDREEAERALAEEQTGTVRAEVLGRGLRLSVIDESGTANQGRPLLYKLAHRDEWTEMSLSQEGVWTHTVVPSRIPTGETVLLTFAVGAVAERVVAFDGSGQPLEAIASPLVNPDELAQGAVPELRVRLRAFGLPPALIE
ncbi:MAG: hypothetical protein AAGB51_07155 [Planctomycetota bacterium]